MYPLRGLENQLSEYKVVGEYCTHETFPFALLSINVTNLYDRSALGGQHHCAPHITIRLLNLPRAHRYCVWSHRLLGAIHC